MSLLPPRGLGLFGRNATGLIFQQTFCELYRSQVLQENMRLKALAEIYTMHSFAQLCSLPFFV